MATLTFKHFRCVEDTNELGGESPYFITWVGDIVANQSVLRLTRKVYWDNNVFKGPGAWPVDVVIASGMTLTPATTLALALMIEKDGGRDITSAEEDDIRQEMQSLLNTYKNAGFSAGDALFVSVAKNTLEGKVKAKLQSSVGADDDLMEEDNFRAARQIQLSSQVGDLPEVTFRGGDGLYRATYTRS